MAPARPGLFCNSKEILMLGRIATLATSMMGTACALAACGGAPGEAQPFRTTTHFGADTATSTGIAGGSVSATLVDGSGKELAKLTRNDPAGDAQWETAEGLHGTLHGASLDTGEEANSALYVVWETAKPPRGTPTTGARVVTPSDSCVTLNDNQICCLGCNAAGDAIVGCCTQNNDCTIYIDRGGCAGS
jgi:hypothetical protein